MEGRSKTDYKRFTPHSNQAKKEHEGKMSLFGALDQVMAMMRSWRQVEKGAHLSQEKTQRQTQVLKNVISRIKSRRRLKRRQMDRNRKRIDLHERVHEKK